MYVDIYYWTQKYWIHYLDVCKIVFSFDYIRASYTHLNLFGILLNQSENGK